MSRPATESSESAMPRRLHAGGFTLLELMIVVAVLGVLASIALPMYQSALQTARVAKARTELRTMSSDIDQFVARSGLMPLTLHEVGHGGLDQRQVRFQPTRC